MEFLPELLLQGGCCFLEMMAACFDVGAAVTAVKVRNNRKARRQAQLTDAPLDKDRKTFWKLVVLIFFAVFFTGLVVFKWVS
jgi:hypothetical protein